MNKNIIVKWAPFKLAEGVKEVCRRQIENDRDH